jgi:hypothetical protein
VSLSPDGSAYQVALSVSNYGANGPNTASAVLVTKSTDGGLTWTDPVKLIQDGPTAFNDKESVTADLVDSNYAYVVWDRSTGSTNNNTYHQPVWFSRTTDGGISWEPARIIYDPGPNAYTIGNQIVVLPNGTLVDVFSGGGNLGRPGAQSFLQVIRSTDHGVSWSQPVFISDQQVNGVADVKISKPIRTGAGLASIAVDPRSGTLYVAWQDSRFSRDQRDGIAFSRSTDEGRTWTALVQVNQAPLVQAFEPALAVGLDGTLALDYFDFRKDSDDPAVLLTSAWRIVSYDEGSTWTEFPLIEPFNILAAPAAAGYFIGDYHGIVPSAAGFLSFFAIANPAGSLTQNSIIAVAGVERGDTSTTSREQIKPGRLAPRVREFPEPPKRH